MNHREWLETLQKMHSERDQLVREGVRNAANMAASASVRRGRVMSGSDRLTVMGPVDTRRVEAALVSGLESALDRQQQRMGR